MQSSNKRRDYVPLKEWGSLGRKLEAREKRRTYDKRIVQEELLALGADQLALKDGAALDDRDEVGVEVP